MAVSSLRSVPWTNETIVIQSFNGIHMNESWNSWINADNSPTIETVDNESVEELIDSDSDQELIDDESSACWASVGIFYGLFTTFCSFERRLSSTPLTHFGQDYIPNPLGPYFYGALFLAALNTHKIFTDLENKGEDLEMSGRSKSRQPHTPSTLDNVVNVVWHATPYLMIITNVALTVLEIRNGDKKAWIKLILTGVTLIDITSWKPKAFNWYLTVFARYPIDVATMYYANNWSRFKILLGILSVEPAHKVEKYILKQMQDLRKKLAQRESPIDQFGPNIMVTLGEDGKAILQIMPLDDQPKPGSTNQSGGLSSRE